MKMKSQLQWRTQVIEDVRNMGDFRTKKEAAMLKGWTTNGCRVPMMPPRAQKLDMELNDLY